MFGAHIKKIRQDKNISIDYLVKLSGIKKSHISEIENNKIRPSRHILRKVIRQLNISYVDLLIRAGTLTEKDLDEVDLLIQTGTLTEEDLDEHNQFRLGTIELAVQEIVEIWYYDGSTDEEYWDKNTFRSTKSAQSYLMKKKGFKAYKKGYSKTRHFQNGCEVYLFAHFHREIKPI